MTPARPFRRDPRSLGGPPVRRGLHSPRWREGFSSVMGVVAVAVAPSVAAGASPSREAVYQAARSGMSATRILQAAFAEATLTTAQPGALRVLVADAAPKVVFAARTRLRLVDEGRAKASRWLPAGHLYRLVIRRGSFVLDDLSVGRSRLLLTGPLSIDAGAAPRGVRLADPLNRRYRGMLRIIPEGSKTMQIVNVIDIEVYLRGVLPGQMPPAWGVQAPQALVAGAIATRTQVLFQRQATVGAYELTADDPLYLGLDGERPAATRAVVASRGRVLTENQLPFAAAFSIGTGVPLGSPPPRLAETAPARAVPGARPKLAPAAVAQARQLLGTPYLWGGAKLGGFDCSGLVYYIYGQLGVQLPRVAEDQAQAGMPVPRAQLIAGDVIFFADSTGYVHHEGLYLGDGTFIHAPHTGDVVKISSLDASGYAQEYAGARRYSY